MVFAVAMLNLTWVGDAFSWELEDGDVVAFVGEAATVELRRHGYLEAALTSRFAGKELRFRNFGWQGDTVYEQLRMPNFASNDKHMEKHGVNAVIAWFGTVESHDGVGGLSGFARAYTSLLDGFPGSMDKHLLLSPVLQEKVGSHAPDPAPHNEDIRAYAGTIRQLAAQRGMGFVDLTGAEDRQDGQMMTDNGVLPSGYGYWRIAAEVENALGMPPRDWQVLIDVESGEAVETRGTQVENLVIDGGRIGFTARDAILPLPPYHSHGDAAGPLVASERVLVARGLGGDESVWKLEIDGEEIVTATAKEWAEGVGIRRGPELMQADALRRAIDRKNRLFFQYWRPTNWDFVYGERVGVPASRDHLNRDRRWFPDELEKFPPLIAEVEEEIRVLAVPIERHYELIRTGEDGQ